jgi:hypothetical protein
VNVRGATNIEHCPNSTPKSDVVSFPLDDNNRRCATQAVSLRKLADLYSFKTAVLPGLSISSLIGRHVMTYHSEHKQNSECAERCF